MPDIILKVGDSILQHGPLNDRVYIMKVKGNHTSDTVEIARELASINGYSKIFAKIPLDLTDDFRERGFQIEASIPRFVEGDEGLAFASLFLDENREILKEAPTIMRVKAAAQRQARVSFPVLELPDDYALREATQEDCQDLAALYGKVFPTYPFPIDEEKFLQDNLKSNVRYFLIFQDSELVAASAAEMDLQAAAVEMTDFATLPEHRGHGFAQVLLDRMEQAMDTEKIRTAFTIARAVSYGMNITFGRAGYIFSGTLRNNTNISGRIESMNVWYKQLYAYNLKEME